MISFNNAHKRLFIGSFLGGNKYIVDTTFVNVARSNMEIQTYMKDGMIDNWDLFEKVLDYTYAKVIQSESQYHPVLFSECSWNVRSNRERLTELMFEKYNVPAFFVVKNAVLAAFANGRATALVVDSGATHTSAVPVHVSLNPFNNYALVQVNNLQILLNNHSAGRLCFNAGCSEIATWGRLFIIAMSPASRSSRNRFDASIYDCHKRICT